MKKKQLLKLLNKQGCSISYGSKHIRVKNDHSLVFLPNHDKDMHRKLERRLLKELKIEV